MARSTQMVRRIDPHRLRAALGTERMGLGELSQYPQLGRSGRIGDPAAPAFVGHVVTPFPGVDASLVAVREKGWGCASGEGKRLMANAAPTDTN